MNNTDFAGLALPAFVSSTIDALADAGYEAYAVGGCVRDGLLGIEPHDWDITTSALPDEVLTSLGERGFDVRAGAGLKHGTVTVVVDDGEKKTASEVTTYRIDGDYTDSRRPDSVSFVSDIKEDLARRDLTINAMATDGTHLIDPFGGREDLGRGIVRCVGEAEKRFTEDALRILRALRFAARFGYNIDKDTEKAMRTLAHRVRNISAERIAAELWGIFSAEYAGKVLPEYADVIRTALSFDYPDTGDMFLRSDDVSVRFALFFGNASADAAKRLKMSNAQRRFCENALSLASGNIPSGRAEILRAMRRYGDDLEKCLEYAGIANGEEDAAKECTDKVRTFRSSGECYNINMLSAGGSDMIKLGYSGEMIGRVLEALLSEVIAGEIANEHDALISEAKKIGGTDVFGKGSAEAHHSACN